MSLIINKLKENVTLPESSRHHPYKSSAPNDTVTTEIRKGWTPINTNKDLGSFKL